MIKYALEIDKLDFGNVKTFEEKKNAHLVALKTLAIQQALQNTGFGKTTTIQFALITVGLFQEECEVTDAELMQMIRKHDTRHAEATFNGKKEY